MRSRDQHLLALQPMNHQHKNCCSMRRQCSEPCPICQQLRADMASGATSMKLHLAPCRTKNASLILDCFRGVMTLQPHWNKRIVSDVWADVVNNRCEAADDLKFSGKELIAAVSGNRVCKSNNTETTVMTNPMGLCKAWCKRKNVDNKFVTAVACHATSPDVLPTPPARGELKMV
jgi:hypothetical protein